MLCIFEHLIGRRRAVFTIRIGHKSVRTKKWQLVHKKTLRKSSGSVATAERYKPREEVKSGAHKLPDSQTHRIPNSQLVLSGYNQLCVCVCLLLFPFLRACVRISLTLSSRTRPLRPNAHPNKITKKTPCFSLQWRKIHRKCPALLISFSSTTTKKHEGMAHTKTHSLLSLERQHKKGEIENARRGDKKCSGGMRSSQRKGQIPL